MKADILATVLLFASSSLAATIARRNTAVVLLTCPVLKGFTPTPQNEMNVIYSKMCINHFHCQHSESPNLVQREFIGACINCPDNVPEEYDGCVTTPQ